MKHIFLAFLLTAGISNITLSQKVKGTINNLKINGIPFLTDQKTILKTFGKPSKQFAPHYECGFFSDGQGVTYYALEYPALNWIGNQKEGYQVDNIFFSAGSGWFITYKGKKLSAQTTPKEFMQLTKTNTSMVNTGGENPDDLIKFIGDRNLKTISVDLPSQTDDGKYIFYFYKDKLCKVEYWSPC